MTEPLEVLTMPRAPSDHPEGSTEWLIAQLNSADDIDVMVAERLQSQAARIAELEAAMRNLIDRYDEVVTTPDCSCSRDDHDVMMARAALAVKP
jgi:hypothetical protein